MKYLFCKNTTHGGAEAAIDGIRLISSEIPLPLQEQLSRESALLSGTQKKYRAPLPLQIAMSVFTIAAMIGFTSLARADVPVEQAYQNAPWAFWGTGVSVLLSVSLWLYARSLKARAGKDAALLEAQRQQAALEQEAAQYLGIPEDAYRLDVLTPDYRLAAPDRPEFDTTSLTECRFFRREDQLCIVTSTHQLIAIPLSHLTGLCIVPKSVPAKGWNKSVPPTEKAFQKCGVLVHSSLVIGLRYCCALEFRSADGPYRLLFPAYELPYLQALTGLPAPALPPKGGREFVSREKVHPVFYWRVPKGTKVSKWFALSSDSVFLCEHPKLFTLFNTLSVLIPIALMVGYLIAVLNLTDNFGPLTVLGEIFGPFLIGAGFLSIFGAWMHQYLGHWVTISLFLAGSGLMVLGALL